VPTFRNISPDRPAPKEIDLFYYQHHIGDYRRDTGHLTLLEHGIYRQLLDQYYLTEKPIDSTTIRLLSIRNTDECESYYRVLADFFVERDGVFFHKRCDFEIQRFKEKSEKATQSIKARWNKNKDLSIDTNVLPTNNEGNTNQTTNEPINQSTKHKAKARFSIPLFIPQEAWQGFYEMRKTGKGVFTERAASLIIKQLTQMHSEGQDVAKVLDQSTANGWKGVFPLKTQQGSSNGKFNVHAAGREALARAVAEEVVGSRAPWEVPDAVHDQIHIQLPGPTDD
jgi:uncharacterized protein YdaU (DUF1376 family)